MCLFIQTWIWAQKLPLIDLWIDRCKKNITSFIFFGGGKSWILFILDGSSSILLLQSINPSNFLGGTPNAHLVGLKLIPYIRTLSKNFPSVLVDLKSGRILWCHRPHTLRFHCNWYHWKWLSLLSYKWIKQSWGGTLSLDNGRLRRCDLWYFFNHILYPLEYGVIMQSNREKISSYS